MNEVEAEFYISGLRKENDELRERCGVLFVQIDHLVDVLASESRTRCPWALPLRALQAGRWWDKKHQQRFDPYFAVVDAVCKCRSPQGCSDSAGSEVAAKCWHKFIESGPPEWWWSYRNPPTVEEPEQETPLTLF